MKELSLTDHLKVAFLIQLQSRYESNRFGLKQIEWKLIENKLHENPLKLSSLWLMEESGGEPNVVAIDVDSGAIIFYDCAPESPKGRRSVCYDHDALISRKEHKPANSALNMAKEMGVHILTEAEYQFLQSLGNFDLKTSSWVQTPPVIRELGGAIFCDRRYNHVFTYHNGAESYYGSRGFRASLSL